jgi:hypothetical protein
MKEVAMATAASSSIDSKKIEKDDSWKKGGKILSMREGGSEGGNEEGEGVGDEGGEFR